MYKWKPHDINNQFKTRQGEKIINLDRYVEVLKENNIPYTEEQYKEAKSYINRAIIKVSNQN
ncbi:hypothetical protein H8S20_16690 [Clostridium sp. NSJ-6]|uniref:Uncharacterized protein n=1 Tax=Clostridium hominis TaxID=2763036 RepID=A0ABR7DGD2_9CLOT|nr:hypothetical protein [Clostridium hominis]MBC5630497.1 hypothetical protein [Clostridium hominis]